MAEAVARVLKNELEKAKRMMTDAHAAREERAHETRKHLKKARAVLRLVREGTGRAALPTGKYGVSRRRPVAFSTVRDAHVLAETLKKLRASTSHFAKVPYSGFASDRKRNPPPRRGRNDERAFRRYRPHLRRAANALGDAIPAIELAPAPS